MSESEIAIVGAGVAGISMASLFTQRGYDVTIFEKGMDYPYPHFPQFREEILNLHENRDRDYSAHGARRLPNANPFRLRA